jgi:hypothetical protein
MGSPLVVIVNNVQYFHNDDDGRNMLLQLQQRAESWAASGMLPLFLIRQSRLTTVLRYSNNGFLQASK